jgi:hypothetical protein
LFINQTPLKGFGTLDAARLINQSSIIFQGGNSVVKGKVSNFKYMEVAGKSVFAGEFLNRGLLKTTDTIVIFKDTYHELGGYISDPSSNYFTNIVIGSTGYLVGGTGDRFIISGDFTSTSTMNKSWNTRDADIEFINGVDTDHEVRITGEDKGPLFSGYEDNYAWHGLTIAPANSLTLMDGNSDTGGGLYIDVLFGAVISGRDILNIFADDGIHIYYSADAPENSALDGETYTLQGSGQLIPMWQKSPDFDHDGDVDGMDLAMLCEAFDIPCIPKDACPCDINDDRVVDEMDLDIFSEAYGED